MRNIFSIPLFFLSIDNLQVSVFKLYQNDFCLIFESISFLMFSFLIGCNADRPRRKNPPLHHHHKRNTLFKLIATSIHLLYLLIFTTPTGGWGNKQVSTWKFSTLSSGIANVTAYCCILRLFLKLGSASVGMYRTFFHCLVNANKPYFKKQRQVVIFFFFATIWMNLVV